MTSLLPNLTPDRPVLPAGATAVPVEGLHQWRDAVLEVERTILSGTDADAVLRTVAQVSRDLVDADVATVAVPRVAGTSLILRAVSGYRAEDLVGAVFPVEESLSGRVLQHGEPLHLTDATLDDNAYQPICELGDFGPTLVLPLTRATSTFGTLLVSRRRGREDFDADEVELLRLFACHVSVAVEFCRGQEELQRLAVVEESERVARELHDTVLQRLFAIGLRLQRLSSDERKAVSSQVQSVLDDLDDTVHEIRSTVLDGRLHY